MITFGNQDTYKITHKNKDEKFLVDYKVLIRLYEPIIGSLSTSLYLTLESECNLNKNSLFQFARLTKILHCSIEQLNDSLDILKENELLAIQGNKNGTNDYLLIICPTKKANEFLLDKKLSNSLKVLVDESYFNQVFDYFNSFIIDENDYVDIDEIHLNQIESEDVFYETFKEKYPMMSQGNSLNDKVKKEISRLKSLFKLNYEQIERAILNSIEGDKENSDQFVVNIKKLNDYIQINYSPNISKDEETIKRLESQSSVELYGTFKARTLLPSEIKMINNLLDQYQISDGVFNTILNYYFNSPNINKTLNPTNYFIKIIESMQLSNVITTQDAINYFRNKKLNKKVNNNDNDTSQINNNVDNNFTSKKSNDDKKTTDQELVDKLKELLGG